MKTFILFLLAVTAAVIVNSCSDTSVTNVPQNQSGNIICTDGITYPLIAGQHDTVGTINVSNDQTNLYVEYTLTSPGCTFGNLHVWAGNDSANCPKTKNGTPIPGQFCQVAGSGGACYDATGLTTYQIIIPLTDLSIADVNQACNLLLYVFAHAEVNCGGGTQTAWGGNNGVNISEPGRWYFLALYNICCGEYNPPPTVDECKTAFAKGGWVWTTMPKSNPENLPSLNLIKNRWGWAINLTSTGVTTYQIWAGAGLNKTSNGTLVGTLTINWTGTTATVTYNMNSGFLMSEVHLYAADERPTTTAPGQYGNLDAFDPGVATYTFTVPLSDTNGTDGVWLIAHAVVCGNY